MAGFMPQNHWLVMIWAMIMVLNVTVGLIITFPIAFGVPLMVAPTPPSVVLVPALLAREDQVLSPVICLRTSHTVLADCLIEFELRIFHPLLAPCPIVRLRTRHRYEQQKHSQRCGSDQRFF